MLLTKVEDRFILRCTYDQREVAKSAGCRWDPTAKVWFTTKPDIAAKLMHFAEPSLHSELSKYVKDTEELRAWSAEMSSAKNGTKEIPAPEGQKYTPFQKAGIEYALARRNTLIADEPGLGKTIEAIGVFNADTTIKRVLIICPASACFNWVDEWGKWATRKSSLVVCNTKEFPYFYDVVIISYTRTLQHADTLREIKWDLLVCDESHNLKNPKAKRTSLILGGTKTNRKKIEAKRVLFLTGTPVLNRPNELWTTLHRLDPDGLGKNYMEFHTRYCNAKQGKFGWDFSGASNLDELNKRLRETLMIRRLKSEVLTELPPKVRQIIRLNPNGADSAIQRERETYERHQSQIERLKQIASSAQDEYEYKNAVQELRVRRTAMFEEMARFRHEIAVEKIPHVIEHLGTVITPDNKVVFFAHHRDLIEAVEKEFHGLCVTITGSTSQQKRGELVNKFQKDPFCLLFIGNIIAAGIAITLTASSHVVCGEFDWRPAIMSQAEDRTHRMGQRSSVLVQHLVFDGSLDALMAKRLLKKQAVIDATLDGKPLENVDQHKYADDE